MHALCVPAELVKLDCTKRLPKPAAGVKGMTGKRRRHASVAGSSRKRLSLTEPLVFLNGSMTPASQAHLSVFDRGVVFGATVAEMTRTFRHQLWRLEEHLARLFQSLRSAQMQIDMTAADFARVSRELVDHNVRFVERDDELAVIHFVTAGEHAPYAWMAGRPARSEPTVCVHTFALPFASWAQKQEKGLHLITPSVRHVPPQCIEPKMKHRSRMHFFLAEQEVHQIDLDASALLLDLAGNVAETNNANFFIAARGAIVTPTTENALAGVSRAMVIELAAELGIPLVEGDFAPGDAQSADESFTSSTPYCLMPVTRINGSLIGDGKPGPIYRRLLAAWSQRVGLDIASQIRLGADRQIAAIQK